MPKISQNFRPVMCATACLHSDDACRQLGEELGDGIPPQPLAQNDLVLRIDRVNLNTYFARSSPTRTIRITLLPCFFDVQRFTPPEAAGSIPLAPAWQGDRGLLTSGWLRPCMRRRSCGWGAARPDESLRGSGPNQWRALKRRSGPSGVSRSCCPSVRHHPTLRLAISSDRSGPCPFLSRAKPDSSRLSEEAPRPFSQYGWPRRWRPASRACAASFPRASRLRPAFSVAP
jgi:hypothetical protein